MAAATTVNRQEQSTPASVASVRAVESIIIDRYDRGRGFDGLGAVSAGGSTRLLFDYPKPARGEVPLHA
jgi:hypothetical protein